MEGGKERKVNGGSTTADQLRDGGKMLKHKLCWPNVGGPGFNVQHNGLSQQNQPEETSILNVVRVKHHAALIFLHDHFQI